MTTFEDLIQKAKAKGYEPTMINRPRQLMIDEEMILTPQETEIVLLRMWIEINYRIDIKIKLYEIPERHGPDGYFQAVMDKVYIALDRL